jgi:predicted aspartyl protease
VLLAASRPARGQTSPPNLGQILDAHAQAMTALHVSPAQRMTTQGTLDGLGLHGSFHLWRDGRNERFDETLGIRTQRTLRLNDTQYVQNANGDVRVLHGLVAHRQITEDFIDSDAFAHHSEDDQLLGQGTLDDGREVWRVRVWPPGGESYEIALDAQTWLIDQKAYVDGDQLTTIEYDDYHVVDGTLVAFLEIDSSGDHAFDVTMHVESVRVGAPIDPAIFAPLRSTVVQAAIPVVAPLLADRGHFFVRAEASGKPLLLLIDSGSQGVFLDPGAADRLGLTTEGRLEVRGIRRTNGVGVAALNGIAIGTAYLPLGVVSVVDLRSVTYEGATVDGVLGYPLFAAAEVRIDPQRLTMTIAKPGTLPPLGTPLAVDTDRELPEVTARINDVNGRFLLDTGNSNELLVFHAFLATHPGLVDYAGARNFARNGGVGGSAAAVPAIVNEIDLGPFALYNRYADVMLSDTGAFADRNDAGNIGLATLRNFVLTFDLAGQTIFLNPTGGFDNGRFRAGSP